MDNWQRFEALAARARDDNGPPVNVAAGVLSEIRRASAARSADLPLWLFSGASLAAATVALLLAADAWTAVADPLTSLFSALTMVMQ